MAVSSISRPRPSAPPPPPPVSKTNTAQKADNKGQKNTDVSAAAPPKKSDAASLRNKDTFSYAAAPTTPGTPATPAPAQPGTDDKTVKVSGDVGTSKGVSIEKEASTGGVSGSTELPGGVEVEGHVNGPSISVDGHADVDVGFFSGVDVNLGVDVDATLAEAGASATKTFDFEVGDEKFSVEVDLSAAAKVGAEGKLNLNLHLGWDGASVSASAEGFAGASGELSGAISLSHEGDEVLSGKVTASATAGVGGSAHADFGYEDGKATFELGAEATVGVGLGVEVSGELDVKELGEAVWDVVT